MSKPKPTSAPPTLADHLARRNRCRYGLGGVSIRCNDGGVHVISHTYWDEGSKLVIVLDNGERISPEDCVLASKWPVVCCKRTLGPRRPAVTSATPRTPNPTGSLADRS